MSSSTQLPPRNIPTMRPRTADVELAHATKLNGNTPKSKWPHISEEIAIRKTLTVKNATEQGNLGTLTYKITCKCENPAKKAELKLGTELNETTSRTERL